MNQFIEKNRGEFNKIIDFYKKEISTLRTGRINPAILEGIQVEAYGIKNPINAVGSVSVADGQSLIIAPYDKNNAKAIEKAITEANLGVSIQNEGDRIRIITPKMTEENRKEIVKKLNEKMEDARISVRKTREEVKNEIEEAEENKEISEDDKFRFLSELDEEVGKTNENIKEIRDKKETEIMTI